MVDMVAFFMFGSFVLLCSYLALGILDSCSSDEMICFNDKYSEARYLVLHGCRNPQIGALRHNGTVWSNVGGVGRDP